MISTLLPVILALQSDKTLKIPRPQDIYIKRPVTLSSLLPGNKLITGTEIPDGIAVPQKNLALLYVIDHRGMYVRVDTLNDLRGYVNIRSNRQALEFVRLLTRIESYYVWGKPFEREIRFVEAKSPDYNGYLKDGYMGAIQTPQLRGVVNQFPKVTRNSNGFIVQRLVIEQDKPDARIYGVEERVTSDGAYSSTVLGQDVVPPELQTVKWHIPG